MKFDQYLLKEDVSLQRGSQTLRLPAGLVLNLVDGRNDAFITPNLDLVLLKEVEGKVLGAKQIFRAPPEDSPVVFVLGPHTWAEFLALGADKQVRLGSLGEAKYLQRSNVAAGMKKIWELRRHEAK